MTFGEKLQALRRARGLSQEQLAEQMGVSRQAVSKWELNTALPDTGNVLELARLFQVSTDYLLREELTAPEPEPSPAQPAETDPARSAWRWSLSDGLLFGAGLMLTSYGIATLRFGLAGLGAGVLGIWASVCAYKLSRLEAEAAPAEGPVFDRRFQLSQYLWLSAVGFIIGLLALCYGLYTQVEAMSFVGVGILAGSLAMTLLARFRFPEPEHRRPLLRFYQATAWGYWLPAAALLLKLFTDGWILLFSQMDGTLRLMLGLALYLLPAALLEWPLFRRLKAEEKEGGEG